MAGASPHPGHRALPRRPGTHRRCRGQRLRPRGHRHPRRRRRRATPRPHRPVRGRPRLRLAHHPYRQRPDPPRGRAETAGRRPPAARAGRRGRRRKLPVPPAGAFAVTRRSLPGRLALLAVGCLLALGLGEVLSRRIGGTQGDFLLAGGRSDGTASLIEPDPTLLWRLRRNAVATVSGLEFRTTVRTNDLGLRGPPVTPPAPGTVRVLLVGDSFTLGAQVDESQTMAARLQALLAARTPRPVEVFNGGVDGYGTRQATLRVEEVVRPLSAKVVVLNFFLGNDLWENARFEARKAELAAGRPGRAKPPVGLADRLAAHSHLFARARATWSAWTGRVPEAIRQRYAEELALFTTAPVPEDVRRATADALQAHADTCARRGLRCLVTLIPPAFAVATDRAAPTLRAYGIDPATMDLDAPARLVTALMPDSLPVVDLTPALRAATQAGTRTSFAYDGHWTAAGHQVAAEATVDAVLDRIAPKPSKGGP
ncbi:MAG: hypothetical protein D6798_09335 [Deltaproteobacteria bacterium]|nr:MAG: hypothetical protein D6798_09335 [Deltaproteobacteria bacterium]